MIVFSLSFTGLPKNQIRPMYLNTIENPMNRVYKGVLNQIKYRRDHFISSSQKFH